MAMERYPWKRAGSQVPEALPKATNRKDESASAGPLLSRIPPPLRLFGVMMAILAIWYGIIGSALAGITVDLAMRPTADQLPPGGSVTLGMAARLVEQQVVERAFTPNDPIFYPTGLTRRTPAFQTSVMQTIVAVVEASNEERQARAQDHGLSSAAQYLATEPSAWWLRAGWPPVGWTAERQYRRALKALSAYNQKIAAIPRQAAAPRGLPPASRAQLRALLDRVEAEAARGDAILRDGSAGRNAAIQLSAARGTAFAAAMLMRGIRDDNSAAIRLSGRSVRWGEALDALDAAATINPLFVGKAELVQSGYSLLLAASAMRDILEGQG